MRSGDLSPMLATAGPVPRSDGRWAYEVKWDGIRALARIEKGAVTLRARTGNDITIRYPELADLATEADGLDSQGTWVIDGEVVMLDESGRPSFQALQHRMHLTDTLQIQRMAAERSVVFMVFDVLRVPDGPVIALSYDERRELLDDLGLPPQRAPVPAAELGDPTPLIEFCQRQGLEGIVAKRRDSIYVPGRRSTAWVKHKFIRRQEMLVVGWTEGTGGRAKSMGALLLGYWSLEGELQFAGKVGTGFSDAELTALMGELRSREVKTPTVDAPRMRTPTHWVEPTLVVEVGFSEWSPSGHLRHPSYQGRRNDIDPATVIREPDGG